MSEQNNIISMDTYRVPTPDGTRLDDNAQVDLHKGDARLLSIDAARAAVEAANKRTSERSTAPETAHIATILHASQWINYARDEELKRRPK